MSEQKLLPEQIEAIKQNFIDKEIRDKKYFKGQCIAVDMVRQAIYTTNERMNLGYLPQLTGELLNEVITAEYLYRSTDIDNLGYNEPLCCTPFYYEEVKKDFETEEQI